MFFLWYPTGQKGYKLKIHPGEYSSAPHSKEQDVSDDTFILSDSLPQESSPPTDGTYIVIPPSDSPSSFVLHTFSDVILTTQSSRIHKKPGTY